MVTKHLFQCISTFDSDCIYSYLLFNANFGDGPDTSGVYLKRGEINIHIAPLMQVTGWGKSALYKLLHKFEQQDLLVIAKDKEHPHRYLLPMYEEHCGHRVRKEEHVHTYSTEETQNRERFEKFFNYYHFLIKTPRADKENTWKEWQKLSLDEREEALRNLAKYRDATVENAHQKFACNYLKSKSFKF